MTSQQHQKIRVAMDIGTNSTRLLIATREEIIHQETTITRIGEGLKEHQRIQPEPLSRTIKVLTGYLKTILSFLNQETIPPEVYSLVATSAMRDAINRQEVVAKIKEETGFQVEVITGEREAELSYLGATGDFPGKNVVIDIGGGSTEVIFQDESAPQDESEPQDEGIFEDEVGISFTSTNLGALRLQENPELQKAENIERLFSEKIPSSKIISQDTSLIGVGGTITTIAAIKIGLEKYHWEKIHGLSLSLREVEEINEKLKTLSLEERKKVPGLQPERADIIIYGIKILLTFMKQFNFKEIKASDKDLLFALIRS